MYGGIFQGSAQEFWREYKIGGRGGWATYTVEVLLLILICQLAAKIRLRLGSFFSTITQFRSAAVVSPSNNYLKLKNPAVSPSIHPHNRVSETISDLDLRNLIDTLDERSYELQKWDTVIDRQQNLLAYSVKSFKPKWRSHLGTSEGTGPYWILDGPPKYLSVTIFENCSAEMLRNFYMDNDYRKKWDKTLAVHEQLEVDESNGTEIGRIIKKFPLLTAREYILAWRVWEAKDGTFYCFSKDCEHPLAPRQKKYVRVEFFKSGWRIRKVPGRNACEIKMVHQEDAGLNAEMAKLAFSKGIWSYVCKMDHALRQYTAAKYLQSSVGVTAVTLIQKVPEGLDSIAHTFGPAYPENSATNCGQIAREGSERKFLRRPSNQLMAKGLILLGGVFCMSRGHSNLGAKVACAYILSKLTKRGASINQRRQA